MSGGFCKICHRQNLTCSFYKTFDVPVKSHLGALCLWFFLGNVWGDFIYDGIRRLRTKHFTALHKPGMENMFAQLSPLSLKLFSSVVTGCFSCVCQMTAREGTHLVGKDSLSLCPFDTVLRSNGQKNFLDIVSSKRVHCWRKIQLSWTATRT